MNYTAANDNGSADRSATVRKLRAEGKSFRQIADIISIDVSTAYRAIHPRVTRPLLAANDNKVVRDVPFNGGWSTNSDMAKVSLARVPTLERPSVAFDAIEERMAA